MKIITIKMDLVIGEDILDLDQITSYLNDKLYTDPEFFGDFGTENIDKITEEDGTHVYDYKNGYASWVKND
jgi:hypothetical protein